MTIKDYCKKFNITDAAVRKSNKIDTIIFQDLTYVVLQDNTIETLKNKIKLQVANTKALKNELMTYTKQDELIQEQKDTIKKLNDKIDALETKLFNQIETKETLYEKVIGHMIRLEHKEN
jgi:hypothetical protein